MRCFTGDGDISEWLLKFEVVCRLQKLGNFFQTVPLFLEGKAFSIYTQLPPATQADDQLLKDALLSAFAINSFDAYSEFVRRRLRDGETPEVFVADLRRLLSICGLNTDHLVRHAFVEGLPSGMAATIRSHMLSYPLTSLPEMIQQAKIHLAAPVMHGSGAALPENPPRTAFGRPPGPSNVQGGMQHAMGGASASTGIRNCFNCGQPGHYSKFCPQGRSPMPRPLVCYRCGQEGHVSRFCTAPAPASRGGNGHGKA